MVVLQTFVTILAIGVAVFLIGYAIQNPGITMIGAIIVIGVSAIAVSESIQIRSGVTEQTINNNTTIVYEYQNISEQSNFPFSIVLLLTGALMLLVGAGEASEQ